jgi:GT2 family glycosyltransferase
MRVFRGQQLVGQSGLLLRGCKYLFISNNDLVYDKNAVAELLLAVQNDDTACSGPC